MSILNKEYELSIWQDQWSPDQGKFVEKKLGTIGSDKMLSQCRALQPRLSRNVNGVKKLTFQMYKHYVDTTTGEQTENPFMPWMINERKVKLFYENEWHDFIIKNIVENSSNYLYTYQLEDALVQELSKNGFNVVLDEKLIDTNGVSNMGTANELAEKVLLETDWEVDANSEAFVQKIDEALVYLKMPDSLSETKIYHIKDQTDLKTGIVPELVLNTSSMEGATILAFYSCCTNKPHRFQFIYIPDGYYIQDGVGNYFPSVSRDENRKIQVQDCQYYIDFSNPEVDYSSQRDYTYNLFLPKGFTLTGAGNSSNSTQDTTLSSWYRGERYGFAQQAIYIPLLERYVNKFVKVGNDIFDPDQISGWNSDSEEIPGNNNGWMCSATSQYSGLCLSRNGLGLEEGKTYTLTFNFQIQDYDSEKSYWIGGHSASYQQLEFKIDSNPITSHNFSSFRGEEAGSQFVLDNSEHSVVYKFKVLPANNAQNDLYIQPNRGDTNNSTSNPVTYKIYNISLLTEEDNPAVYYGYENVEYVSTALTQNMISNSTFTSTGGWTGTYIGSGNKVEIKNVYGRFDSGFTSATVDLQNGTYDPENNTSYIACLEMDFSKNQQDGVVINSGPYDNRSLIQNMDDKEQWVIRYKATTNGTSFKILNIDLGEYTYNSAAGGSGYKKIPDSEANIIFSADNTNNAIDKIKDGYCSIIYTVTKNNYTLETFKKNSQVRIAIKGGEKTYLTDIALFKAVYNDDGELILPEEQANDLGDKVLDKTYYYFSLPTLNSAQTKEDLKPNFTAKKLKYDIFEPLYNSGAQKVRSVTAKESNYFNILQSIAETFGAWLKLNVQRDSVGGIISKTVAFKNYIGQNNHAGFKYGINLKDIQRTFESKNIVTKLVVKQNSNELGQNGFCTIARAGANPSGEIDIYDFQYFHNNGLLDAKSYLNSTYGLDGAIGPDMSLLYNSAILPFSGSNYTKKDVNNNYGTPLRSWDSNRIYYYYGEDNSLTNDDKQYVLYGSLSWKLPNGYSATDAEGNPQIGIRAQITEGSWSFSQDDIQLDKQSGTISFKLTLNSNLLKSNQGASKKSTGIRFIEVRKNTQGSWSNGYKQNQCVNAEWDDYFYGTKEQGSYGMEIFNVQLYLVKTIDSTDSDFSFEKYDSNINGYFPRLKAINNKITDLNEILIGTNTDLTKQKANYEVAKAGLDAADNGIEQVRDEFLTLTGTYPNQISNSLITDITLDNTCIDKNAEDDEKYGHISYSEPNWLSSIEITKNSNNITFKISSSVSGNVNRHLYIDAYPILTLENGKTIQQKRTIKLTIEAQKTSGFTTETISVVDMERNDVKKLSTEYLTYNSERETFLSKKNTAEEERDRLQAEYDALKEQITHYLDLKRELNRKFYKHYSRFIQEGTWISEDYADDEKYYADAQSVMYNSCFPKVAYAINVLELSKLPGYENFAFKVGEKTYAEDSKFFGSDQKVEVVITELTENLDDPTQNTINVQNFKNQFQDLFQKITASVQQAQYSTGSYEKAVALAEAKAERKNAFVSEALSSASARLNAAGNQTVNWDSSGLTIVDDNTPSNSIKMVGGAILLSKQDENGIQKWTTGITSDGVSANLITAGILNAGEISIMNYDEPVFRWDSYGLTAYDAIWNNGVITGVNNNKFVRFDKYGIYGINSGVDGASWTPVNNQEIMEKSTFALTWEGFKVTGSNETVATIGRQDDYIMVVKNSDGEDTFRITNGGKVEMAGDLNIGTTLSGSTSVSGAISDLAGDIAQTNSDLNDKAKELAGAINAAQTSLQAQIDGSITTYFLPYLPSASKYPVTNSEDATGWGKKYSEHNGDLFYIVSPGGEILIQSTAPESDISNGDYWINGEEIKKYDGEKWEEISSDEAEIVKKVGYCYRWQYTDTKNETDPTDGNWILITDTAVTEALASAAMAQETADGKMVVYSELNNETIPNNGDLLIPTSNFEQYKEGKVYKYNSTSESWEEINYTPNLNLYVDTSTMSKSDIWFNYDKWTNTNEKDSLGNVVFSKSGQFQGIGQTIQLVEGKTYTLSATVTGDGAANAIFFINEGNPASATQIKSYASNEISTTTRIFASYSITKTAMYSFRIENGNTTGTLKISSIKLEEGSRMTDWIASTEDTVSSNVNTNDFSWKFSSTEGMYMWDGEQGDGSNDDAHLVFKIWDNPDEDKGKELYMKGHVVATSGFIGNWELSQYTLTNFSGDKDANGFYPAGFCMQVKNGNSVNALAIGKVSTDSWSSANFRVTHDGKLYAKAGEIAGWTISSNSLSKTDNTTFGVSLSCPTAKDNGDGTYTSGADVLVITNYGNGGAKSYPFVLRSSGYLVCSNIHALGGKVAGWTISGNSLKTEDNALYLGTTGIRSKIGENDVSSLVFKAGDKFGVTSDGKLYAVDGEFTGKIKAKEGLIGGFALSGSSSSLDYTYDASIADKPGLYAYTKQKETEYDSITNGMKFASIMLGSGDLLTATKPSYYYTRLDSTGINLRKQSYSNNTKRFSNLKIASDAIRGTYSSTYGQDMTGLTLSFDQNLDDTGKITGTDVWLQNSGTGTLFLGILGGEVSLPSRTIKFNDGNDNYYTLQGLKQRVDELGFKGPYTITATLIATSNYAATTTLVNQTIGKICQLGKVVYGYLDKIYGEQLTSLTIQNLSIVNEKNEKITVPGPLQKNELSWLVAHNSSSYNNRSSFKLMNFTSGEDGNLLFNFNSLYNGGYLGYGSADSPRSYFCYATNSDFSFD